MSQINYNKTQNTRGTFISSGSTSIGVASGGWTSTSTGTFINTYIEEFRSALFIEEDNNNFIEMIYEKVPTLVVAPNLGFASSNKIMVKKVYGVIDGKLQLIKAIVGIEEPGYYVEPSIEWKE